jgi:hypothetical protein
VNEHLILPLLLPLCFLVLVFLAVSCVGCTDRVLDALRRMVHSRGEARARHPSAPAS